MKKFALALMTTAVAVFGFGAAAQAQYGSTPAVEVSPPTVVPGGDVTVSVTGCTSGEILTVTFNGDTTTDTCVASSSATIVITAPSGPGTYGGTVVGSQGFSQTFQVVVVAAASPPGGGLPATGSGINSTMTVAAGLFAMGLGLFGVTQFRRRQSAVAA